jgi:PAS domain S-box-containing protein
VTVALDPKSPDSGVVAALAKAFDVQTTKEVAQGARLERLGFAGLYALASLVVLPWPWPLAWMVGIVVWEMGVVGRLHDLVSQRLTGGRALIAFATMNLFGSCLFQALALLCFAEGSPLGVILAATWIGGAVLNSLVYFNGDRALLWGTLLPVVAATLIGPWLAYGFSWPSLFIPVLLGVSSLAARRFSLDHGALVRELADRQVAFADLERKLAAAIEASGDGYFEYDLIADELVASPTWSAMLGYAPGELPSPVRDWRSFIHPDDLDLLVQDYDAHLAGTTPHTATELRMRCKDGAYRWVFSRARLISRMPDGRPWQVIGTTLDISVRKALEHQLEAARDQAESANAAKGVFVANMSHEIRTPLNGVIGIAGALARTSLSDDQREMVGLVQSSGQMLDRMLSDILDQAKIEAGNFQLQAASLDLAETIEAAAALMRARADEKGLGFHVVYGETAQGMFEGDGVRIRQIVSNLASNAIKFTQAGEVAVRVEVVDRADAPSLVRIEVADSGIGFDKETADRLFNRFIQADGSISRQFGGTGLGLAICKSLTELMGGEIGARSEPGKGSVFTVEIPLPRTMPLEDYRLRRADAAAREEEPGADPAELGSIRILLAEDHPTNQRVVQLILEPTGVALTIVGNGREAVEAFQPGRFDLILMDMQMPVMDGLAATREIRALEAAAGRPPVPIAMFTANAMDEHLDLAAQAGANHHIAKPITPARLLEGIDLALSQPVPPTATLLGVGA